MEGLHLVLNQHGPDHIHIVKVSTLVLILWSLTRRHAAPRPTLRAGRWSFSECTFPLFGSSMSLLVCPSARPTMLYYLPGGSDHRSSLPCGSYRRSPLVLQIAPTRVRYGCTMHVLRIQYGSTSHQLRYTTGTLRMRHLFGSESSFLF